MDKKVEKKVEKKIHKMKSSLMNPKLFESINELPELALSDHDKEIEISSENDLESITEDKKYLLSGSVSDDYYTLTEVSLRSSKSELKSIEFRSDIDDSNKKIMSFSDLNDLGSVGDIKYSTMNALRQKKEKKMEIYILQMKIMWIVLIFALFLIGYLIYVIFTTDVGFLDQIAMIK